jgi:hypothetical protein
MNYQNCFEINKLFILHEILAISNLINSLKIVLSKKIKNIIIQNFIYL